ncbi:tetratricopeptide-like helical domain-containing protein, partial [Tanacetum coccineum]
RVWDGVAETRKELKDSLIKKEPGHSFIEVQGVVEKFTVGRILHSRIQEIVGRWITHNYVLHSMPADFELGVADVGVALAAATAASSGHWMDQILKTHCSLLIYESIFEETTQPLFTIARGGYGASRSNTPAGNTVGRWLKERRKKQETRAHNAQLHATLFVVGVAATVATFTCQSMKSILNRLDRGRNSRNESGGMGGGCGDTSGNAPPKAWQKDGKKLRCLAGAGIAEIVLRIERERKGRRNEQRIERVWFLGLYVVKLREKKFFKMKASNEKQHQYDNVSYGSCQHINRASEETCTRSCDPFKHTVVDPKLASYSVENLINVITQLAQPTTRSNLGKITLDKTFEEIDTLNTSNHTHSGVTRSTFGTGYNDSYTCSKRVAAINSMTAQHLNIMRGEHISSADKAAVLSQDDMLTALFAALNDEDVKDATMPPVFNRENGAKQGNTTTSKRQNMRSSQTE